jgi:hypothetical protein
MQILKFCRILTQISGYQLHLSLANSGITTKPRSLMVNWVVVVLVGVVECRSKFFYSWNFCRFGTTTHEEAGLLALALIRHFYHDVVKNTSNRCSNTA